MRQKGEGDSEDIDIFRRKHVTAFSQIIAGSAETTANYLLAEELTGKRAKSQNMRNRFGIPTFGQHTDGNDIADFLAAFAFLSNRIYGFAQNGCRIRFTEFHIYILIRIWSNHIRSGIHRFGVDVDSQVWVTQLRHRNTVVVKCILDTRRRFCTVSNSNHDWRYW